MKTNRSIGLIHVIFVLAGWPIASYAEKATAPALIAPPTNAVVTITVTAAEPSAADLFATTLVPNVTPAQWIDIKDCTSEMRDSFFAGLTRLKAVLNDQISELAAQRAATIEVTRTKDLDVAIQEMRNARFFLRLMGDNLSKATPQKWDQQKAKVGLAWEKAQEAYTKVKTHTII